MIQGEDKAACQTPFRLCAFTKGFDRLDYSRWNGVEEPSEHSGAGFKVEEQNEEHELAAKREGLEQI